MKIVGALFAVTLVGAFIFLVWRVIGSFIKPNKDDPEDD
jgi:hypothetical protein